MLALWREWGIDKILRKAYAKGVILAGISAGANCWFEQCSTDASPGTLGVLDGLGLLNGGFCPHYDGETERRPSLHRMIAEERMISSYAVDNSAAVHFIDEQFFVAVSSVASARAYRVWKEGSEVQEEMIKPKCLIQEI